MSPEHNLCMKCHENEATVRITRIVNGEVKEIRLCQECASKYSPFQKPLSLNKLLANLLKAEKHAAKEATPTKVCSNCGISLENYRATLFLGCKDCYRAFEPELKHDLRKYHGSVTHIGKTPKSHKTVSEAPVTIEDLRAKMEEAIEREDFESAAAIRDEIRALKEKMNADHTED